jgi:putative ABC transport system permease protein
VNLSDVLKAQGRSHAAGGRARSFGGLVTAEMAITVILLVGAALMLQSFRKLLALDPGFAKTGVCAMDLTFRGERYNKPESRVAFFEQMRANLQTLPGFQAAGGISQLPLGGNEHVGYFLVEGAAESPPGHEPLAETRPASLGALEALGMRLVRGRDFDKSDGLGKRRVAIVNETLVREFFPATDPLGKRIRLKESPEWLTIVGVIRDVRGAGLELRPRPAIYGPFEQDPAYWDEMTAVVRFADGGLAPALEQRVRGEIRRIDPDLPLANFRTVETLVGNAMARPRFGTFLMTVFAATALVLAMVGLYGVVAYSAAQRTRELGVRMALGAPRFELLMLVIAQGMRPALVGLALGVAGAFGLSRLLASQLYDISPTDPRTLVGVSLALVAVALLACWLPARRAARIDPMLALRYE